MPLQVPINNGGVCATHWWSQTLDAVTVNIPVHKGTRAKQLQIDIQPAHVSVRYKNSRSEPEPDSLVIMGGDTFAPVRAADAIWTLDPETSLVMLSLDKLKPDWWESVFVGGPRIDTSLVDSTQVWYQDRMMCDFRAIC